jgi:hypothetical protein
LQWILSHLDDGRPFSGYVKCPAGCATIIPAFIPTNENGENTDTSDQYLLMLQLLNERLKSIRDKYHCAQYRMCLDRITTTTQGTELSTLGIMLWMFQIVFHVLLCFKLVRESSFANTNEILQAVLHAIFLIVTFPRLRAVDDPFFRAGHLHKLVYGILIGQVGGSWATTQAYLHLYLCRLVTVSQFSSYIILVLSLLHYFWCGDLGFLVFANLVQL